MVQDQGLAALDARMTISLQISCLETLDRFSRNTSEMRLVAIKRGR
jgi:hypothetical protein